MFKPGWKAVAFIGFAQLVPTLFPFVECQSRLLAAYAVGRYALPAVAEINRVIEADQQLYTGHCTGSARHTQQVDFFTTSTTCVRASFPRAPNVHSAVARR
jgi:hypothetical protein